MASKAIKKGAKFGYLPLPEMGATDHWMEIRENLETTSLEQLQEMHRIVHQVSTKRFPRETEAFLLAPASDSDIDLVHEIYDLLRSKKISDVVAMCEPTTEFVVMGPPGYAHHGIFKGQGEVHQHLVAQSTELTINDCCPQVKEVKKNIDGSIVVSGSCDGILKTGEKFTTRFLDIWQVSSSMRRIKRLQSMECMYIGDDYSKAPAA